MWLPKSQDLLSACSDPLLLGQARQSSGIALTRKKKSGSRWRTQRAAGMMVTGATGCGDGAAPAHDFPAGPDAPAQARDAESTESSNLNNPCSAMPVKVQPDVPEQTITTITTTIQTTITQVRGREKQVAPAVRGWWMQRASCLHAAGRITCTARNLTAYM